MVAEGGWGCKGVAIPEFDFSLLTMCAPTAVIPRVWEKEVLVVLRRVMALLAATWVAIFAPVASASNGLFPASNGPVQNGRGSTDLAIADTPLCMNTNPAGITRWDFLTMSSALGIYLPVATYDDPQNDDERSEGEVYPIPNFGIVFGRDFTTAPVIRDEGAKYFSDEQMQQFTDEFLRPRADGFRPGWTFGIGMFIQGGAGAHFNLRSRLYPEGVTYFSNFAMISLAPTAAYQISPKVSVGAALNLNYSTQKLNTLVGQDPRLMKQIIQFDLFGLPIPLDFAQTFLDLHDTNPDSNLTETILTALGNTSPADGARTLSGRFNMTDAKAFGLAGRFGVLVEPEPWLSIGAAYATRTWMTNYKGGKTKIDFDREITALGPLVDIITRALAAGLAVEPIGSVTDPLIGHYDGEIRDFNFPAQTGLGFAVHPPGEDWLVSAEVKYIQWADVLENFTVKLENGDNPMLNALIGSNDPHPVFGTAARAPSKEIRTSLPLNLKNQWVVNMGGEYRWNEDLTLRAGYSYASDVADDNVYLPILPAIVRHRLHLGFSYQVFKNTWMDMSWEHGFTQALESGVNVNSDDLDNSRHTVTSDTIWTGFTVKY